MEPSGITIEHETAILTVMDCPNCRSVVGDVWFICDAHLYVTEIPNFGYFLE